MSTVDTPSYSDVTAAQVSSTMPRQARNRALLNQKVSQFETSPPSPRHVYKQENTVVDWVLGTPLRVALIWSLMVGFCIGFWAALWFSLPSVVFSVVVGSPIAVWLVLACWTERHVAARRHLSLRLSRVFGVG